MTFPVVRIRKKGLSGICKMFDGLIPPHRAQARCTQSSGTEICR